MMPMPDRPSRDTDLRNAAERLRTFGFFGLYLFFFATLVGGVLMSTGALPGGWLGLLVLYLAVALLTVVLGTLTLWIGSRTGAGLAHTLLAGGDTSVEPAFSYEESLVARGKLDEAERAFERRCLDQPEDGEARIRRADFYDRVRQDPARAERFYREARRMGLPPSRDLYVSLCLADLARSAGRTDSLRRELAAIIERYGDSLAGQRAREELAELGWTPEEPGQQG